MSRVLSVVPRKTLKVSLAVFHCVLQSVGCTNGVVMASSAVAEAAMEFFVLEYMAFH